MKIELLGKSLFKSVQTFKIALPIIAGVLLLVNVLNLLFKNSYASIFTGNPFVDPIIGASAGSISFGMPLTSFIVGGELLKEGISLMAVSAFIIAWSTVGVAMLPLEASFLGKRFAIVRNVINFVFSILIAIATVLTLNLWV